MVNLSNVSYDLKDSNGQSLVDNNTISVYSVELIYYYLELPRVILLVTMASDYDKIMLGDEFEIDLITNTFKIEFKFCITEFEINDAAVKIFGVRATADELNNSYTYYLDSELSAAIKKCTTLTCRFNTKITGEFYQINETKSSCLLRLLKGISKDKPYTITESEILLIDQEQINEVPLGTLISTKRKQVSTDKSEPVYNVDNDYFSQGWAKNISLDSSSSEYIRNYLSALKFRKGFDLMFNYRYDNIINALVGSACKLKQSDMKFDKFYLAGKSINLKNNKIYTDCLFGVYYK